MREILNLVKGAVSTKDLVPVLTHFLIYGGRIQGGNGRVSIDAECSGLDGLNFAVPADRFIRAIDACGSDPTLKLHKDKLVVKSAGFRASLPILPAESYPYKALIKNEPYLYSKGNPRFLDVLRKLKPFISTDASRPWSNSVFFRDGFAYATNNVVLARIPCDYAGPEMQVSTHGVDEILRIGQEIDFFSLYETAIHFSYKDFWMDVQGVSELWPSKLGDLCDQINTPTSNWVRCDGVLDKVSKLEHFFPDKKVPTVVFEGGRAATLDGDCSAEVDLGVEPGEKSLFNFNALKLVLGAATSVNLSLSPNTAAWKGDDGIEGLISKMRV